MLFMKKTHSGFVAIVGPTNAGKSTLLNQIMGRKVSAVSHKVQTTRTRLRAVKMVNVPPTAMGVPAAGNAAAKSAVAFGEGWMGGAENPVQLIFVDTPGIFKPNRRLDRAMVSAALDTLGDSDAILLMIDATHGITQTTKDIITKLPKADSMQCAPPERGGSAAGNAAAGGALFAFINKADAVKKDTLLPMIAELSGLAPFREIFIGSALKGDGIEPMLASLAAMMPESPYLFDAKDATDVPDTLWLAEITREKVYKFVHQELPYRIFVATEKVETAPDGVLEIWQKIVVATDGHKKIVVGKGGEMLQKIGTAARHEIQDEWGVNARLHLFVRVEKDWENRAESYEEQGLEFSK
jgi:GTP-binding protein Era